MNDKNRYTVLLYSLDKETAVRSAFALSDAEGDLIPFQDFNKLLEYVKKSPPELLLIDIDHSTQKPLKLIQTLNSFKQCVLIGITRNNPLNIVVQAVRYGVRDVLSLDSDMLKLQKEIGGHYQDWRERDQSFLERQKKEYDFSNIIGQSQPIQQVFNLISKIVKRKWVTVLVYGETGTGKELIARTIHYQTCREDEQFVEINCSALPETLLESEYIRL
ncbi:MAG: sigma 54-interacting transcriptional regulator [candidate division KSB1 bacterium]|nr:sigma 54-interacting transcriptional regulator [candidate division KSB1 bacterium]